MCMSDACRGQKIVTEVKDDCELTRGCWELNTDPQQDQQALLIPELPL